MSSTLIIGIGTSGLEIIEQAQQFHYEFTGKNRPGNNVEYIYVETNENRNPKKTALGTTDIISVKVPLDGAISTLNKMKENSSVDSSWAPNPTQILLAGVGAGGAPSYGRLSIWDSSHFANLKQTITSAHQRLGARDTKILIVGTLTGGTGSGLCIDIAYLTNYLINQGASKNTNGLFLIPDSSSFGLDKALFENAFSGLTAIDKYQHKGSYRTKFIDGSEVIGNGPPFEFVQYLSPQFNDNRPALSKGDLVRVAGITVSLQIMDTDKPGDGLRKHFASLLLERRVDSKTNDRVKNSISSGFAMIQYPQYQIQELLSIKIAKEVIYNLIDSENYIDKNGNKKSIKSDGVNIKEIAKENLESILKRGYEHLGGVIKVSNGDLLSKALEKNAESILKKNHGQATNSAFYYSLFKTGMAGNYFDLIIANKSGLRDRLIEEIYDYINTVTNEYKNVRITELVIEQIIQYIPEVLKHYKEQYDLTGKDNTWDRVLQNHITQFENQKTTNGLLLITKEATLFALQQTAELAKIHSGISLLEQIREELQSGGLSLRSLSGKELPSKNKVNQITDTLETLVKGNGEATSYTLDMRENELNSILSANNSCFKMLYVNGSKDQDLDAAYNNYKKSIDSKLTVNKLFDVADLWPYFIRLDSELYTNCIKNAVSYVRNNKFVGEANLINIIKNISPTSPNRDIKVLFNKQPALIKSENVPALVPLDSNKYRFEFDNCAKLIFISKNHAEINNNLFLNKNYMLDPGVSGSNAVDLPDLENTIIIYQEYGYMGDKEGRKESFEPLNNISYMNLVKEHLRKVTDEPFKMKKVPYLTLEEFKSYIQ
jgi:hypothetical protein